jgi:DNA-nicking Smr family endonuclease
MNFGDILDKWEKGAKKVAHYDKEVAYSREEGVYGAAPRGERRARLLRKNPDDSIDLHGLTRDLAWTALQTFFENSRAKGHEKLLIIHGKGNHQSNGETVQTESTLRELSRSFIEQCAFAGESGYSPAKEGGSGATWVILKE